MSKDTIELYHHGVLGQKWGIRRYQNPDGSLTSAGKQRYGVKENTKQKSSKRLSKDVGKDATKVDPDTIADQYYSFLYPSHEKLGLSSDASYEEWENALAKYHKKVGKNQVVVEKKMDNDPLAKEAERLNTEFHEYAAKVRQAQDTVIDKYGWNDPNWNKHCEDELRKLFNLKKNEPIPRQIDPYTVEHELQKKYASEMRGAILKDLGYKDTEAGRKILFDLGISDYEDSSYDPDYGQDWYGDYDDY